MSEVTLSLKLQTVLDHLDAIDDVFSELDVETALQWQDKVEKIRIMVRKEIKRLDRLALENWEAAQPVNALDASPEAQMVASINDTVEQLGKLGAFQRR